MIVCGLEWIINNLGHYFLFISPNDVMKSNDVNDDGLPLHVDEVLTVFLIFHKCVVASSLGKVMRRKDQIISIE